ncbi:hypothetical protein EJB05_02652, partial [Eragrostis curvula]
MAARVLDVITIRVGSLWIDVPMGPLQTTSSAESLRTTAASPAVVINEKEVSSKPQDGPQDGFTPVMTKSAKRKAKRAAKERVVAPKMRTNNMRKASPSSSKPQSSRPPRQEAKPSSRRATLGEWPVYVKATSPKKLVAPPFAPSSTLKIEEPSASMNSPNMLGVKSSQPPISISGGSPTEIANTATSRKNMALSRNKGKAPMVESNASSSEGESCPTMTRLRADAPEFIPSPVYDTDDMQSEHELRWQGVYLSQDDIKRGHVNPFAAISDPISSEVMVPKQSAQSSTSAKRRQRRRRNARQAWAQLPAAIGDPVMVKSQREFIVETILAQHEKNRRNLRKVAHEALQVSLEKTICQDLRSLLPGVSPSDDTIGGKIMRRAEALAKQPEYHEFVKKDPRREKYAKQAANIRAKRDEYKLREMALPVSSMCSRIEGPNIPSTSQVVVTPESEKSDMTPILAPWPTKMRNSSKSFQIFSSMPVGITDMGGTSSETSSTSTHFKRKKSRHDVDHRPVTRSQTNSGNMENNLMFVGSYNPLYNDLHGPENELLDTAGSSDVPPRLEGEPSQVEQVLATNDGRSVDEQMDHLTATLQQKEDELATLRQQTAALQQRENELATLRQQMAADNARRERERNAAMSQGSHQPTSSPQISPEAIQRMIAEGVKAQYMQTHYSMRPGYMKPYPPEIDMVPFPTNYRQPQFSKFNGTGAPHEHVAHFLAACQDTSHNGALLLRQFVQTLSGPAFTWYSKLAPGSIRTWEEMQAAFLERFYSTQRQVGITELTQIMQRANENAADFINRWRNLSLHCTQSISEPEAVRMCMNNLSPDMAIYLQGVRPVTFEELASKATDIENYMQHISRQSKTFNRLTEKNVPRDKGPSKPKQMQAMETTVIPQKFQTGGTPFRNQEKGGAQTSRRPTLSERQNQEYSFPMEEVEGLFMGLRELNLIELPKPKRPEEAAKFKEPNFCHYHRILGHTLKDCFVVKNIIQKMIDEGVIDDNLLKNFMKGKKVATSNVATFEDRMEILGSSKLSAKMKARLSFGGPIPQDMGHLPPEDQESVDSNAQDDVHYDK